MKIIGLTGSIASGKSTVAAILSDANIPVIDADQLSHAATAPHSPTVAKVAAVFPGVVDAHGVLQRKKLASIVFDDREKRKQLESIVHPEISRLFEKKVGELKKHGHHIAVYVAPLLFETGLYRLLDKNILVVAYEHLLVARMAQRDGLDDTAAKKRLSAQMSNEEKAKLADEIIINNGSIAELKERLQETWFRLTKEKLDLVS